MGCKDASLLSLSHSLSLIPNDIPRTPLTQYPLTEIQVHNVDNILLICHDHRTIQEKRYFFFLLSKQRVEHKNEKTGKCLVKEMKIRNNLKVTIKEH